MDKQGLKILSTVNPLLQKVILRATELSTLAWTIDQGKRTPAQQEWLYASGRTRKGPIVTYTRNSKHLLGRAIDFRPLINGKMSWDIHLYPPIAAVIKHAGFELGIPIDRKSTRLNSSHSDRSRMPSSA